MCLHVLSSVLWCPFKFPHKNHVPLIFTPSCMLKGASFIVNCTHVHRKTERPQISKQNNIPDSVLRKSQSSSLGRRLHLSDDWLRISVVRNTVITVDVYYSYMVHVPRWAQFTCKYDIICMLIQNVWLGPLCWSFSICALFYYVSSRSEFRVVMSVEISAWKRCSSHLYTQLFVEGLMFYWRLIVIWDMYISQRSTRSW
jgi:hypothetical protein